MAWNQKSTIVRFTKSARWARTSATPSTCCPVRRGGSPGTCGSRRRRGWPSCRSPTGVSRSRSRRKVMWCAGRCGATLSTRSDRDGVPGARLGRAWLAVRCDGRAAPRVRPPGGHARRAGTWRLRPRPGGPAAYQRAGVREGAGRGVLQVRAGGGRGRALARHDRDLPCAAVRLARHEEAGRSSRRWSSRSRCSTSSRPRWASASAPDGRSTARSSTGSGSRWPSSTHASRPRTSTRCPRWSSPTAATARRRTTTSSTSRSRSTRRSSRQRASGTARSSATGMSSRVSSSSSRVGRSRSARSRDTSEGSSVA